MVARVLVVLLTTAVFSSAASSASTLHDVSTTPGPSQVCANVVVHANAAIDATLLEDDAIARVFRRLQTADFDTPGTLRTTALAEVGGAANAIRDDAARIAAETRRLRGYALAPAGDDRRADLDALADALDASADRGRDVAHALDAFSAGVAYRMLGPAHLPRAAPASFASLNTDDVRGTAGSGLAVSALPTPDPTPPGDTKAARSAAAAVAEQLGAIRADEARAADHGESAIGGC